MHERSVSSMSRAAKSVARILLVVTTLFFIGPQLGSLDIDGDGVPDVPVIAVHAMKDQNLRPPRGIRQVTILLAKASLYLALTGNGGLGPKGSIVIDQGVEPDRVAPLRC